MSETSVVSSAVFITWCPSTAVQISVGLLPSFSCSVRSFTRPDPLLKSWIQLPFALKNKKSLVLLLDRTCQEIQVPDIHTAAQKTPQVWGFFSFQLFLSYSMAVNAHSYQQCNPEPKSFTTAPRMFQQPSALTPHTGQNKAQKFILLDPLPGS